MLENIEFDASANLDPGELLAFYRKQHHGLDCSVETLRRMVDQSFCLVVARHQGEMIGFARGVTDGVVGQLMDCKLDPAFQGPGCVTKKDGRIEHDSFGIASEMARRVVSSLLNYGVERIETLAHETEIDFCQEMGFHKAVGCLPMRFLASEYKEPELVAGGQTVQD